MSIESRVVPGTSETIVRSAPISLLKSDDLPTFGRPRIATRIASSPTTGRGIARVLDRVEELYAKHAGRIPTPELNRFLAELKEARQPPSRGRKRLNLLYGVQVSTRPPRYRFTVNDTSLVTRDYGYWVENELRARFGLEGVPVAIDFRRRS